jgi:drug/metabolite transporter (DMT)-like permease
MSIRRVIGLVLVVAGIAVALWGGVFWTDRDTLVDAGPIQVTREEHKGVSLPPLLGILAAIAGTVMLVVPDRRHA